MTLTPLWLLTVLCAPGLPFHIVVTEEANTAGRKLHGDTHPVVHAGHVAVVLVGLELELAKLGLKIAIADIIPPSNQNVPAVTEEANDKDPPLAQRGYKSQPSSYSSDSISSPSSSSITTNTSNTSVDFQSLFPTSSNFGPAALLYPSTLTNRMNYDEASVPHNNDQDGFSIPRPTIELPLDELLSNVDSPRPWSLSFFFTSHSDSQNRAEDDTHTFATNFNPSNAFFVPNIPAYHQNDVIMQSVLIMDDSNNSEDHTMTFSDLNQNTSPLTTQPLTLHPASFTNSFNPETSNDNSSVDSDDEASSDADSASSVAAVNNLPPSTSAPTPTPTPSAALASGSAGRGRFGKAAGSTPRPHLTLRTGSSVSTRSGVVLGATPTSLNSTSRNRDEDDGASTPSGSAGSSVAAGSIIGGRGSGGSVTAPVGRTGAGASAMGTESGMFELRCDAYAALEEGLEW
ncbi:hypothetical protein VKT23_015232 [Stygiomarasmius scandens]|uniref:Uncharacterized protein n=1 Tax=Marasmiellus scandens TaxID=2682957 RepID=A0ABR1J185_9AGAR